MLKCIDPLLSPELLKLLCEMGHGDEIVLADANFTAESLGRGKTAAVADRLQDHPLVELAHPRVIGSAGAQACLGSPCAARRIHPLNASAITPFLKMKFA